MIRVRHELPVAPHSLLLCALFAGLRLLVLPAPAEVSGVIPYSVRVWQIDDGLPQNSVHAIAQTPDGYLWVGTHDGLARFDGVRFVEVTDPDAQALKQGWITALYVARDGSLWIGCEGNGVFKMKHGRFTNFTRTNGLPSNQPRCFFESKDGALWIGSEGGLTRYHFGKFNTFTDKHGLGDNSTRSVCEDGRGVIHIATGHGLSSLSNGIITGNYVFGPDRSVNALKSACVDGQGRLWIASSDGLHKFDHGVRSTYGINDGLPDKILTSVYEDRRGQLWVGTYTGVARVVNDRIICGPRSEAAFSDLINTVFEDREENLWVGARDGLYRLTPRRFSTYTTQQGLNCNNVISVCEDRAGSIWLATWGGGLNKLRDDSVLTYTTRNGLARDEALSLYEGRDGSLWTGLDLGGGVSRFRPGSTNSSEKLPDVFSNAVRVIHEDREGRFWVGTSGGLRVFKNGEFIAYTVTNGLPGNLVMAICENAAGELWIGTDGGLTRCDDGKLVNFTTREGLSHNSVNGLYEDKERNLWIATKAGGLNRMKSGRFTAYTTRQGLFSDEIYEVVEDDFSNFWLSCRKGIFRVSKKDLDELDQGKIKTVTSTVFGKADGLVSVQCNGVAKPAGWKSRDGRIWFPTIRGVVAVESRVEANTHPPPVMIEAVFADQKLVRDSGLTDSTSPSLTLPPGRGEVAIHYNALSFQAPEKNRFKYKLDDVDWNEVGASRVAHFYLTPGSYRFQVMACNNDGVWNPTAASLAFVLQPHYWQTWWFKLAGVVAAGLLLVAWYRYRMARLREIENLRVQIAADLHDDVGARLTKVAMVTEMVDGQTTEADRIKPQIRNISTTTREIIQAMDEIVWTINPKNDTLDNLANYIFHHAQDYFHNSGIRCRMDLPAQLPELPISTETRHNLFMAVKEAMNNVLKHAGATEVRISLALAEGGLTFIVADNGRGFHLNGEHRTGDGLINMQKRLAQIGGRLVLESEPGRGTNVKMEAKAK